MIKSEHIDSRNVPYNEGVSLFIKHSKNRKLISFFLLPWSVYREEKLRYELNKLSKANDTLFLPLNEVKTENEQKQNLKFVNKSELNIQLSQKELKVSDSNKLPDELKELYRLRGHLHGGLHKCYSDQERYNLAFEIIATQNKIEKFYAGDFESDEKKIIKPILNLEDYKKRNNARIYLARLNKELKNCTDLERKKLLEIKISKHQEIFNSYGGTVQEGKSD